MRTNDDARYSRVTGETLNQRAQPGFVDILAKEDSNRQSLGERTSGHWRMMLPPAVNQNAIYLTALVEICLPRGLAMDHREIVSEPCDRRYRHAVRDKHDGH